MAYDERLAMRARALLKGQRSVQEKKMFGGLAYMSRGKMFAGILNGDLVVRVGPKANDTTLKRPHTRPMDFTGRPMKGYIYVGPGGTGTAAQLRRWLMVGQEFVASLPRQAESGASKIKNAHPSTKEDVIMTTVEIGKELVALCRQGKNMDAITKFYSPAIESVEAIANPQIGQVQKGIEAVKGKNKWWVENHRIHNVEVNGPFPNGDQFIVQFTYDVTPKHTSKRMTMSEMGLFTVRNSKIAKEVFFYSM